MKTKNYSEFELNHLINRFELAELPRKEWTHEAHLVVAIWYSYQFPFQEALNLVRKNIINHNTSVGTPNNGMEGYHETITKFWLLFAKHFLENQSDLSISELCNGFIDSTISPSDYPLKFYSEELLFSVDARKNWKNPDLNNFNF